MGSLQSSISQLIKVEDNIYNQKASEGSFFTNVEISSIPTINVSYYCEDINGIQKCDLSNFNWALNKFHIVGHDECLQRLRDIAKKEDHPGYGLTDGGIAFVFHDVSHSLRKKPGNCE